MRIEALGRLGLLKFNFQMLHLKFVAPLFCAMLMNTIQAQNLEKHTWENRVLLIQSADPQSESYQSQLSEFEKSIEALAERKLVLYQVVNQQYKFTDFQKAKNSDTWNSLDSRDKVFYFTDDSFKIILIGLDGGVKLEQSEVLKLEELIAIIDAMPMRRGEIEDERNLKRNSNQ